MSDNLAKRFLIGGIPEDAYGSGTDGTTDFTTGHDPDDWYAVRTQGEPPFSEVINTIANQEMTATHSTKKSHNYGHRLDVSLTVPLKGKKSTAGDPPFGSWLLKAMNLEETVNATTSTVYRPVTGDDQTRVPSAALAMYMFTRGYDDAYRWVCKGVRGNGTLTLEMGENATLGFEGAGLYAPWPTDLHVADNANTLPTTPTEYSGEKNTLEVIGMTFEVDTGSGLTAYPIESMDLQTNWSLQEDMVGTKADRTLEQLYLERGSEDPPGGGITFKGRSAAMKAILPLASSGADCQITVTLSDGTDTVELNIPVVQFSEQTVSLEGSTFDATYAARGDFGSGGAAETDFELTYT